MINCIYINKLYFCKKMEMEVYRFSNVSEIETKLNYPRVKGDKFILNESKVPQFLLPYIPYVEYYVSKDWGEMEIFFDNVPLHIFEFLNIELDKVQPELISWLEKESGSDDDIREECLAFSLLMDAANNYDFRKLAETPISDGEKKEQIKQISAEIDAYLKKIKDLGLEE
jgi:hypothetical protein